LAREGRVASEVTNDYEIFRYNQNDRVVGELWKDRDTGLVEHVSVDPELRRQGIGTELYNAAGINRPSDILSDDASAFWSARQPQANASQSGGLLGAGLSEAQRQARDILDMRAAGNARSVTDDMMSRADDQYMFNNTPLPMDEASRLARADAGGFGGDLYHGSNADFAAFNPEALDATGQKIMAHGDGTYLGQQARMAERYATRRDGGVMYPVRENMENPWTGDMSATKLSPEDMATYMAAESGPEALGFSGRRNTLGISVVPDPSNIRSRFARFDPEFSHLSNLSAANASPTAGLLASGAQEQDKPLPFMEMLRGLLR
jgi:hypothetical protein